MLSYKLAKCSLSKSQCTASPKRSYTLQFLPMSGQTLDLKDLEQTLNTIKHRQDPYYAMTTIKPSFQKLMYQYDIFNHMKRTLKDRGQRVSNAWLKLYELIHQYKLIDEGQSVVHFDNAAFPGSFILAANHYAKTVGKARKYTWYASSWIGGGLDDEYHMYKKHPNHWLMNTTTNDGNVNDIDNQRQWETKLRHTVTLYTSDLGFATGKDGDYTLQEDAHVQPNIGQILSGILTLAPGGHMVTKQYTFFNTLNISLYAILTNLFEDVYISKPATSRPANSESYIVAKRFKGPFKKGTIEDRLVQLIIQKISTVPFDPKPLVYRRCLSPEYLSSIAVAADMLCTRQMFYIQDRIRWYDEYINADKKERIDLMRALRSRTKSITTMWKKRNPVRTLPKSDQIPIR